MDECIQLFRKYKETFKITIQWLQHQQFKALRELQMSNSNGRMRHWTKPNYAKIEAAVRADLAKKKRKGPALTDNQIREIVKDKYRASEGGIKREGANFMIQSINADMTKTAMARMRLEFKKRGYDSRMYNSVYDEIVVDHHKSTAEAAYELQQKIMLDSANEMLRHIPMEVEGHLLEMWTK